MNYKIIPILSIIATPAFADLNLPTKFFCNGEWHYNLGGGICHDEEAFQAKVKIKIPPTKGQFRAVNCERELTKDGNPDDFNTAVWKTGWWLWQKTVILPSETPEVRFPLDRTDNCPISMSLAALKTGVQSSIVFYEKNKEVDGKDFNYGYFADYSCAKSDWVPMTGKNPGSSGVGVGFCRALTDATLKFRINKPGITEVIGSQCEIIAKLDSNTAGEIITVKVPKDFCVIDLSNQNLEGFERARFFVIGVKRDKREIDSPTQFKDGDKRRVVKPIGTDFIHTEIYEDGKRVWSSGEREDNTYHLDPTIDNKSGYNTWQPNTFACHTAYNAQYDSVSGSCYNLKTNEEVPYFFN